jgi:hypothetical protein
VRLAGVGAGEGRLLHTSFTPHAVSWAWTTAQKIDLWHSTPLGPSSWKEMLKRILICLLTSPSHCLEATSSMQPPSQPMSQAE